MKSYTFLFTVVVMCVGDVAAQTADISTPKQRDKTVDTARSVLAARSAVVVVPDPAPNPFIWPAEAEKPESPSVTIVPTMGKDLLAQLAAQIPVTGTVSLGGEPLLLLGQKRLKVGDTLTISFEGQNYELSIAAIATTSFTVKRGELTHTRATRLSSSSRP